MQPDSLYASGLQGTLYESVQPPSEQCRSALKESIRVASDTNEIASRTAEVLDQQSEQIAKIVDDTDKISGLLDKTEYLLKGMKGWFGALSGFVTGPPAQTQPANPLPAVEPAVPKTPNHSPLRHMNEFDEDLDTLSQQLGEMHDRAKLMNSSISDQNSMLNRVQESSVTINQRLQKQNQDMSKVMGR
ncbi:MAG: hypothetical protein KVP17_004538 [Porospora cf. gigantea B]|uniref:uncharacterized protein n=2 Tax=Porospora cf. gigantea B TaxID=2853592 RepID=UPI003571F04C|nr:MAG: hypothetical protein KVP17_004538 [Porospora cf. gigantea B]